MGLNVYLLEVKEVDVYDANITHNLTEMADKAGIYEALWRPEEINVKKAKDLIRPLEIGLAALLSAPGDPRPAPSHLLRR